VIAATSTPAALAARTASTTIPIVFTTAGDPVRLGLVISLSRPGGNITGATQLNMEVTPKRLELLRELVPTATDFAYLVNPSNPLFAQNGAPNLRATAEALGLTLHTLNASSDRELELALASAARSRFDAIPWSRAVLPRPTGRWWCCGARGLTVFMSSAPNARYDLSPL
jgi:putative ABC transport system substrate-binding protein